LKDIPKIMTQSDGKDRRSGMANSSVNAPPKKDGAGGKFTMGSASDDYKAQTGTQVDAKDPNNVSGQPEGNAPAKGPEKTFASNKTSEPTMNPPQKTDDNFPDLTAPGESLPPPSGAWAKN